LVSTGKKPFIDLEYDDNGAFSSPLALEADVLDFTLTLQDLKLGVSTIEVELNNKEGKYDDDFPAIPDETGLNDFLRQV